MKKEKTETKKRGGHFSHGWKMLLACVIPLALILLLPLIGISNKISGAIGIGLMIVLHILMLKEHKKGGAK